MLTRLWLLAPLACALMFGCDSKPLRLGPGAAGAPGAAGSSSGTAGASGYAVLSGDAGAGGAISSGTGGTGAPSSGLTGAAAMPGSGSGGGGPPPPLGPDAGAGGAPVSDLPPGPGPGNVPPPSGELPSLTVLPWAGFLAAVTFTVDDVSSSVLGNWPLLKGTGIHATYYPTIANSSAPWIATLKDVMAAGNELGNHTMSGCNADLVGCTMPLGSLAAEIDQATAYLMTVVGVPNVWTMAYPFGDTGYEPLATQRFFLARGAISGMIGPEDAPDPYDLPCIVINGNETVAPLFNDIADARNAGSWLIFALQGSDGGGVMHLFGAINDAQQSSNVWIATLRDVGAYWVGRKLVQAAFAAHPPLDAPGAINTWAWTLPPHFPPGRFVRVVPGTGRLFQGGQPLAWDPHGYYEVSLDVGTVSWMP